MHRFSFDRTAAGYIVTALIVLGLVVMMAVSRSEGGTSVPGLTGAAMLGAEGVGGRTGAGGGTSGGR